MVRVHQTKQDILATNILFAALFLTIPVNYVIKDGYFSQTISKTAFTALIVVTPFILAHYYYIRAGYKWAKVLFVILSGLSLLFLVLDFKRIAAGSLDTLPKMTNFFIQQVIQFVAFILVLVSLSKSKNRQELSEPDETIAV